MPIRIARSERTARSCVGVRQLLAADPRVEIVAAVPDQRSLRRACDEEHPDVVLTDIRMPPTHRRGWRRSAEIDQAKQLLDSGAITLADCDVINAKALA